MREIKFRAWKKGYGMNYDPDIDRDACLYLNDLFEKNLYFDIVMQYTGVKDKSSKEIYEGDILKIKKKRGDFRYENFLFIVYFEPRTSSYRVYYLVHHESNGGHLPSLGFTKTLNSEIFTYEVLGNIYENPELIKDE